MSKKQSKSSTPRPVPDPMYHTDDLLRKHHLLLEDRSDDDTIRVRLVDWETHEAAHPDAALAYLGELTHGNPGFPGPEIGAALLEWVATLPRPAEPYVRKDPNPNQCLWCGDDHDECGCPEHYTMIEQIIAYKQEHADGDDPASTEER